MGRNLYIGGIRSAGLVALCNNSALIAFMTIIPFCHKSKKSFFMNYTGCVKSPGTTFRGCPGLESDFSKKSFYDQKKILVKSSYDYKIFFLRNYF